MLDPDNLLDKNRLLAIIPCASSCMTVSNCNFSTIRLTVSFFRSIIPTFLCRREGRSFSFIPLYSMYFTIAVLLNPSSPEIKLGVPWRSAHICSKWVIILVDFLSSKTAPSEYAVPASVKFITVEIISLLSGIKNSFVSRG